MTPHQQEIVEELSMHLAKAGMSGVTRENAGYVAVVVFGHDDRTVLWSTIITPDGTRL